MSLREQAWFVHGTALAATMAAALLRSAVDPWLGQTQPFFTFYLSVLGLAWWADRRPALLAAALGLILGDWLFVTPRGSLAVTSIEGWANVVAYLVITGTLIYAIDCQASVSRALARISDRHEQAEAQVASLHGRLSADLAAMEQLHEISVRFARQDDLSSLLKRILDAALAITGAPKGHVQLLKPASDELGIVVHLGYNQEFVDYFSHIHSGTVACGTAVRTRHCVIVEDVTVSPLFLAEPKALELLQAAGVRAVICTPLMAHTGQLVGVLSAHFASPHHPSQRDLRLLNLLARQAADFVERAHAEQALNAARQALARANTELEQKVRERTARLEETVAELEQFSYTITHDMRAPLRAMQGLGGVLLEGCADCLHPVRADYIRRISEAAGRMDKLITDALSYAGAVRQRFELTPVDPGLLLRGILESYPHFQAPQAHIVVETPMPAVLGNEAAMTQCFSNLLGNAVKFVEPGKTPEVRVWAEPLGDRVRLWFADRGIGIEKQYQEKIWVMFQRVSKSYEGTGIGLALVAKAVERMGGKVGVQSEPGKGSRFWVELKRAGQVPSGGASQPDQQSGKHDHPELARPQ